MAEKMEGVETVVRGRQDSLESPQLESASKDESVSGIQEQPEAASWQVDDGQIHVAQVEEELKSKANAIDAQLRMKSKEQEQRIAQLEQVEADYVALKESYQICSKENAMLQERCSLQNSKFSKMAEDNEELKQNIVRKDKQIDVLSLKLADFISSWEVLHSKWGEKVGGLSLKLNEVEKERNFLDSSLSELQSTFEQYQEEMNIRVRRVKEQYRWRLDGCLQEIQQLKAIVGEHGKHRSGHSAEAEKRPVRGSEETTTELQREIQELKTQ